MSSENCSCENTTSIEFNFTIAEEVVFPLASYVAMSVVLFFSSLLVFSRMLITVEITSKSDLVLFNTSPQRQLELLVSKHASSAGAMNNIHTAIALGLMIAPPNYVPPATTNSVNHHHLNNAKLALPVANGGVNHVNDIIESTPARPKKPKWWFFYLVHFFCEYYFLNSFFLNNKLLVF